MVKISRLPYLLLLCMLGAALGADGARVSPSQALERALASPAVNKMKKKAPRAPLQLRRAVSARQGAEPMLYLFSNGAEGFVLTPADDAFPALLGYGEAGALRGDSVPAAMSMFMREYAREMEFELSRGVGSQGTEAAMPQQWTAVEPLLKSRWNQDAPFNKYAPIMEVLTDGVPNGTKFETPIGCVATAMAQLMYFHKWPEVGEGSNSYVWKPYSDVLEKTISCDFSQTPFAWSKMLDYYPYDAQGSPAWSEEAGEAVARLMHACAVSVNMRFNADFAGGSGAYNKDLALSLIKYFKYSRGMKMTHRDYTTNARFEEMIYGELKQGYPVVFDGRGAEGGHSFLCDGYAGDHYFHFNWGWGGVSDGYFYLGRLNPETLGIGGGSGGFNYSQGIIYNIRPLRDGADTAEAQLPFFNCVGNFDYSSRAATTAKDGSRIYTTTFTVKDATLGFGSGIWNMSLSPFTGYVGVAVMDTTGKVVFVPGREIKELPTYQGLTSITAYVDDFPAGEYGIYPAYYDTVNEQANFIKVANGFRSYVVMTVNPDGSCTFANADRKDEVMFAPQLAVSCFSYSGKVYSGEQKNFLLSLTNLSENLDYYGDLTMVLKDSKGRELASQPVGRYDVPAGQAYPLSFSTTLNVLVKDYTVVFRDSYGRTLPGEFPLSIAGTATPLTTQLRVQSYSPTEMKPNVAVERTMFNVANYGTTDVVAPVFVIGICKRGEATPFRSGELSYSKLTIQKQTAINLAVSNINWGVAAGEYDVRLYWRCDKSDGSGKEDLAISNPIPVRIGYPVTDVAFEAPSVELETGKTLTLSPVFKPANATFRTLQWVSSNPEVATVDNAGLVTAVAQGSAYITAAAYNAVQDVCLVTVKDASAVTDINLDEATIRCVYTPDGVKVLTAPTRAQLATLPPGLYIVVTDQGNLKLRF